MTDKTAARAARAADDLAAARAAAAPKPPRTITCARCGSAVATQWHRTRYCAECKPLARRDKRRAAQRRQREHRQMYRLGIPRRWTATEDRYLLAHAADLDRQVASVLERTIAAVRDRRSRLLRKR